MFLTFCTLLAAWWIWEPLLYGTEIKKKYLIIKESQNMLFWTNRTQSNIFVSWLINVLHNSRRVTKFEFLKFLYRFFWWDQKERKGRLLLVQSSFWMLKKILFKLQNPNFDTLIDKCLCTLCQILESNIANFLVRLL